MNPITLVALPFAGAGASFFRPWPALAPAGLDVVALQLPGRERRLAEEPFRGVQEAATALVPDVLAGVLGRGPVVLFGHSLGAVLAFELAQRLAVIPGVDLRALLVSGSPGPWTQRPRRATGLPDDEFLQQVQDFAGYSHDAMDDPEMRDLLLPVLRADVQMHEFYRPVSDRPVPVPITALRGDRDELVSAEQAQEWAAATGAGLTTAEIAGGHMYLTTDAGAVQVLRRAVEAVAHV